MSSHPPGSGFVSLSVQVYRLLLRAYPQPFRSEYAEWMDQAFRDSCLAASRSGRWGALPALWGRTALDFILSLVEQYSNRGSTMTRSRWIKFSGWSLFASGIVFLLGMFAGDPGAIPFVHMTWRTYVFLNRVETPLTLFGMALAAAGVVGLAARFIHQASGLGKTGLILAVIGALAVIMGGVGTALEESSPWWEMFLFGTTGLFLGLVLFGSDCLKLKHFRRWNLLPVVIGIPWLLLVLLALVFSASRIEFVVPEVINVVVGVIALGGLALIGYRLQADTPGTDQQLA